MNLQISKTEFKDDNSVEFAPAQIKVITEPRFCHILIDWLAGYVKREIKKASAKYECCSWREAFDQVLIKEDGPRADRFQIYQELIDLDESWDLAKINE